MSTKAIPKTGEQPGIDGLVALGSFIFLINSYVDVIPEIVASVI